MAGSIMEAKYKDFLRTFWRLSEQDGYPVVLREFEQVISLIQGDRRMTQNELNRPFSILSVDAKGDFSTFDPELLSVASDRYGTFNLGNLKTHSLEESTRTEGFERLLQDMALGVETCHESFEHFGLCGGGNGSNKFLEHDTLASSETNDCRFGTKIPTEELLERFEADPPLEAIGATHASHNL
jgi:uncharacterized protein